MSAILTLTGMSGSGKTTLAGELLRQRSDVRMIQSVTTRCRRESDLPGEYEYVSKEDFERFVRAQFFLWHVSRGDVSYGTDRNAVFDVCDKPRGIGIMILVPSKVHELAEFIRGQYGLTVPVVSIYLESPGEAVLRERLLRRGESAVGIDERMSLERTWPEEIGASSEAFHFIPGGKTLEDLPQVVAAVNDKLCGL